MRIAVVGAGIAGLSAAYDLLAGGHEVELYESDSQPGGLATGFRDERWQWPLERFYHHLFTSDEEIIGLATELGMRDQLIFPRPTTSIIYDDRVVPFDSPLRWITFPGFNFLDVARFGLVSAYLRFTNPWRQLERTTADDWLQHKYGEKVYNLIWRPLLIGKFGPYYQQVNMAWMWARLKVRSPKLGYFVGGFQAFVDTLAAAVEQRGGRLHLSQAISNLQQIDDGRFVVRSGDRSATYDAVLVTTSPGLLSRLAPQLPEDYLRQLLELKSMGAVVMTLALEHSLLSEGGTYWLNIPASSPDKSENEFPFLALVEHTNFIARSHYGGDHLLYCGDYVEPDHPYMTMDKDTLQETFAGALSRINPKFEPEWIRKSWLFRSRYAQPVPLLNHSEHIPALRTPLSGLYFASMSQVYPWDRGTNFAVEIGRQVARMIAADARKQPAASGAHTTA